MATILGTLAIFIWGGFSHTVLLSGVGFDPLPNEEVVLPTLRDNISKRGLYFFPGRTFANKSEDDDIKWMQKFKTGPAGILVYRPIGGDPFSVSKLSIQFVSNLLSVLIAILLVWQINMRYWRRVGSVTLLGCLSCAAVSSIYWNWYEFPTTFFIAQLIDMVVGFFIVGLIVSKLVPYTGSSNPNY